MVKIKKIKIIGKKYVGENVLYTPLKSDMMLAEKINEIIALVNNHDVELDLLKKQFTDLIVKLQAFGTLPLEEYDKPAVDELSPGLQQAPRKESTKVQKLKKKDPF